MHYNNRMPVYRRKSYPKRKVKHTELKNGIVVFVEGPKPNPYKDVPCESLSIGSRIETGTFESHEGMPHQAEKVSGADKMTAEIERQQNEYETNKKEYETKKARKERSEKIKKAVAKFHPEVSDLVD